jgi:ribonuclease VapC
MIVLDSSVIVAVFRSEPGGDDLLRRLSRSRERVMSAANWFEAAMVIEGKEEFDQTEEFDALIAALGVAVVPLTPEHAQAARNAFRRYGKGRRTKAQLNFGDCLAYALAMSLDAPLLFKGEVFARTDVKVA